jgi:alpha-tubulin suppressor-like RCC1 family protein
LTGYLTQRLSQGNSQHACLIHQGLASCWGDNTAGQLGLNTTGGVFTTPSVDVTNLGGGVTAVATGLRHTCAIKGGRLFCWGANLNGQLGNGTYTASSIPVPVTYKGVAGGFTAVSLGAYHTCAVQNGAVLCWGLNSSAQLGDGSTTTRNAPTPIAALATGATTVAAGTNHTCAVRQGGAYCWGDNANGQLGDLSTTQRTTPVAVGGLPSGVTSLAAGNGFTCGTFKDHTRCFGLNTLAQLARTTATNSSSSAVYQVNATRFATTRLSLGDTHGCSLSSGVYTCWGNNTSGQVGNGLVGGAVGATTGAAVVAGDWQ